MDDPFLDTDSTGWTACDIEADRLLVESTLALALDDGLLDPALAPLFERARRRAGLKDRRSQAALGEGSRRVVEAADKSGRPGVDAD